MNKKSKTSTKNIKPLRLWPGIILVLIQWIVWLILPIIEPDTMEVGVFGGMVFGLFIILWWAFFSRAKRFDRWLAILLMIVALMLTSFIIDISIQTAMMGLMFPSYALPVLSLAFVLWAILTRKLNDKTKRISMVISIIIASGFWTLLRTDGMSGEGQQDLNWRWASTYEEQLIDEPESVPIISETDASFSDLEPEWPGFRGPNRDGVIHSVKINTDWNTYPPKEVWRKKVGPGCSSFALQGNMLFTQEQRDENELVTCYNLLTGELIWKHADSARFWDSHVGAGPRSTPTIHYNRIYSSGATGIVNVLNADDGSLVWSKNAATTLKAEYQEWGYSGSPLVIDSIVIVPAGGNLIAYNIENGDEIWVSPEGGRGYSSPQQVVIGGISQVLFMHSNGISSFNHKDGSILWEYKIKRDDRILQPIIISENQILISAEFTEGAMLLDVRNENGTWKIKEKWTTKGIKPNFNDFIYHKGHIYGFVGTRLACIDSKEGKRKWKRGRYGGQILLLADQDLLLVLSEKGELVLVEAKPDKYNELAIFQAIEGKTWNHPILVNDLLLIRNTNEMAAFKLTLKK